MLALPGLFAPTIGTGPLRRQIARRLCRRKMALRACQEVPGFGKVEIQGGGAQVTALKTGNLICLNLSADGQSSTTI